MNIQIEKIMVAADHEARAAAIVIHYNEGDAIELRLSGGSLESLIRTLQNVARELSDKH